MYKAYLYVLDFPNGKSYVGISKHAHRRFGQHKTGAATNKAGVLYDAIRKYGWDNVRRTVLVVGPREYIESIEIEAIAIWNCRLPYGYNTALGGRSCAMLLPEVAAKLRGRVVSDETRAKLSAANKTRDPAIRAAVGLKNKGRVKSDETRAKIVMARALRKVTHGAEDSFRLQHPSAATLEKMQAAARLRSADPAYRAKLSVALKNRDHTVRARAALALKNMNPEKRKKLSAALSARNSSPAARAKLSASKKEWWANKKREVQL